MRNFLQAPDSSCLYYQTRHDFFRITEIIYPPNTFHDFHTDARYRLSIVLSGKVKESSEKQDEWASTASIVYKSPAAPHKNRFGPKGARIISIEPSLTYLKELENWVELPDWQWYHHPNHAQSALQFVKRYKDFPKENGLESMVIDLFSNLIPPAKKSYKNPPQWLALIMEEIHASFTQTIMVQQLARKAGVHPVYLARIFRQFYHCSIKEYICRLRLRTAMDALSSSPTPLVHIALNNGFADQAHFNRVFKTHLKFSPGKFRDLVKPY